MPLTPADVHNVAFKKPPIGKRGYDEDEVDAFLDLVEAEFARLIEENAELRSRVAEGGTAQAAPPTEPVPAQSPQPPPQADQEPEATPSPDAPTLVKATTADELSQATRMLALATETAERHVAEAREERDRLLTEARTASEQMIAEANTKSEQQLAGARTTSEQQLAEAKNRAETLDRDSQAKARTLTQDAERRQGEIMGSLEQRKAGLEREIDALRTFEREYRTRLKSYLESQLRDLDARTSAEPAGAGAQQGTGASGNSASQSSN
ncbi:MAG: DivIVA domain-containing protein [Geodermatophilaceae bacterium]|nr:DivIVA domain-containing protein [Geodermatophilaceae bacterium]MDQ3455742.1 DivIVA domain-containing protein [Actinomycetota bacterium]